MKGLFVLCLVHLVFVSLMKPPTMRCATAVKALYYRNSKLVTQSSSESGISVRPSTYLTILKGRIFYADSISFVLDYPKIK